MKEQSKSIEQYGELLSSFKRIQLKKIEILIEFLRDKLDLVYRPNNVLTVDETEIQNIGLSLDDVKNTYSRFCAKTFEVFRMPNKANLVYPVFILPNPTTSKSKIGNKTTMCIDIGLFSQNDPRSDNFRNFTVALQNKISEGNEIKKSTDINFPRKGISKIEKLTIVKSNLGSKYKIIVNDDYQNPIQVDKVKPSWDLLLQIAGKDMMEAGGQKSSLDYFNNNKRCKIYTRTGHQITKILKVDGGYILPGVEMGIITEKAFQQRANKNRKIA